MGHWVQIEMKSEGNITSCIQLDLELVTRVSIAREDNKPFKLLVGHGNAQIVIEGEKGVLDFLAQWEKHTSIKFKSPPNQPSPISVAKAGLPSSMTGKTILRG